MPLQSITSPILFNEVSLQVTNLQLALTALGYTIDALDIAEHKAGSATIHIIRQIQSENNIRIDDRFVVDQPTADFLNQLLRTKGLLNIEEVNKFKLKGKLTDANLYPLKEHIIVLSEYDLLNIYDIDKAISKEDGSFEFAFDFTENLKTADDITNPDICFKIYDPSGAAQSVGNIYRVEHGIELAVSRLTDSEKSPIVLMNIPNEMELRIQIKSKKLVLTEFERLVNILSPLMQGIGFADLQEDEEQFQISFLSKESGIEKVKIELLKNAFAEGNANNIPAWALFELSNLSITGPQWINKTIEDFVILLKPLQPSNHDENLKELAEKLLSYAKEKLLQQKVSDLKINADGVLDHVFASTELHDNFFRFYAHNEKSMPEFWKEISANPIYKELVPKIQLSLQLSQFTLGNKELIQSLQNNGIVHSKQLVQISQEKWQDMILMHPDGIPSHIEAETLVEKASIYARELQTMVEIAYPTEVIKNKIVSEAVKTFLNQNSDFDFTTTPIDKYLQVNENTAWHGIENKEKILQEIRQTQRLFAVTTSVDDIKTLYDMGFESAFQISKMTASDFVQTMSGKIEMDQAFGHHARATAITESASLIYTHLREMAVQVMPSAVGVQASLANEIPNWENLFGQIEMCECVHCKSVYSPSAYFVDLLHILLGQKDGKARKELFRRRPDLKYTKLTCEHTDTLIPYIDLVNEILETYLAQDNIGDANLDAHVKQTTNDTSQFTETELSANPQHLKTNEQQTAITSFADAEKAYAKLRNEDVTYPLTLPFDLPLETARCFLEGQNTSRYNIMKTFGDAEADTTYAEYLGLSELEYRIIFGSKLNGNAWDIAKDFFGYEVNEIPVEGLGAKLKVVTEFLGRTNIAYTDLIDLVKTNFLNASHNIVLALQVPINITEKDKISWEIANACNLDYTILIHDDGTFLIEKELQKFNRFIRLWKKLACTIQELDILLSAVGKEFDVTVMKDFSRLYLLKNQYNLTADDATVLISNVSEKGEDSLYSRLFLNKAILQIDPKFELDLSGTPFGFNDNIKDHIPALLAALRIKEEELNAIFESDASIEKLTMENISKLYRYILVARINQFKIQDFIYFLHLSPKPDFASVHDVVDNQLFFTKIKRLSNSSIEIAYLFDGKKLPGNNFAPKQEIINKSGAELKVGLLKLLNNSKADDGLTTEFLQTQLSTLFEEKIVSKIIGILNGEGINTDPQRVLDAISTADLNFLEKPDLPVQSKGVLDNYLSSADLQQLSGEKNLAKRYDSYWAKVSQKLKPLLQNSVIQQHLISQFNTDANLISFLYQPSTIIFKTEIDIDTYISDYKNKFESIFKCLWLIKKLKLNAIELKYFQGDGSKFENFNWPDFSSKQIKSWLRIADYCNLRDSLPVSDISLINVFESSNMSDATKAITAATAYNEADVLEFCSSLIIADLQNEIKLVSLKEQIELSNQVGVSIEKLKQWGDHNIDQPKANDIKQTLKAKYDESEWIDISSKIHNILRNLQRDALVAYLLHKPNIKNEIINTTNKKIGTLTTNDLYEYFLIDVEMDAINKTSRIKQAISSVQLFVQRCVMNLEDKISPTLIDEKQLYWMKNYRVWEANRKIFLYPENWIEPELRDNKSPFFKELESELLQAEVTKETVEKALVNYLYKLDDVARLDICGTYEDAEANELHVFGRTFNNPPQYYYRKLNLNTHVWTAWEKVQLDIQGNEEGENSGVHLIPVVWNRRLYLFWPVFTERRDKEKQEKDKINYENEIKKWDQKYKAECDKVHNDWLQRISSVPTPINKKDYDTKYGLPKESRKNPTDPNQVDFLIDGGWYFVYWEDDEEIYFLTEIEKEPPKPEKSPKPEIQEIKYEYWEIKLAWSEFREGRWTTKRMSKEWLDTNQEIVLSKSLSYLCGLGDLSKFAFEANESNPELEVKVTYQYSDDYCEIGSFNFSGCNSDAKILYLLRSTTNPKDLSDGQLNDYQGFGKVLKQAEQLNINIRGGEINLFLKNSESYKFHRANYNIKNAESKLAGIKLFYQSNHPESQLRNYYIEPRNELVLKSLSDSAFAGITVSKPNLAEKIKNQNEMVSPYRMETFQSIPLNTAINLFQTNEISSNTMMRLGAKKEMSNVLEKKIASPSFNNTIGKKYMDRYVAKLDFKPFFHAYLCTYIRILNSAGIDNLLTISNQLLTDFRTVGGINWITVTNHFKEQYKPNSANVFQPYPLEEVDFSPTGAYSMYNWELFFHIPMLIANRLSKNQKFEEAMRWYHFIFNPTTHDPAKDAYRYWQVLPLRNTPQETLKTLMQQLNLPAGDSRRKELETTISYWRESPFSPHLIARMRLSAYQKNVVMKYLDNLIAWADNLFRQDTIEAINQATQLYIMAAQLVGQHPEKVPVRGTIEAKNYKELEDAGLNAFSNALVQMETVFPFYNLENIQHGVQGISSALSTTIPAEYFGLPNNPKLLSYWELIADRLFKIRHSLNIEGVERQLVLFEPPIDPALLVEAVAKGIDINTVLADLNAPMPYYRFGYIIQKALEICSELKSLSNNLLSVLEKKDNEALTILRTQHEEVLLGLVREVKKLQIKESQRNREGLDKTKEVTENRLNYYTTLIKDGISQSERMQELLLSDAKKWQDKAGETEFIANMFHIFPNISTGIPPSSSFGGSNLGSAANAIAKSYNNIASAYTFQANKTATYASNERRFKEWIFQQSNAIKELEQIDKQIKASTIRENIADKELNNHEQQIENAQQVAEYLRNKYTQEELYGWMQGEISTIYFQCYQLAYDLAKKAEKCYRHELGIDTSNFIQFGSWDSFRKGLLSGESLYLQLKQLEKAYMDHNRREYEITKHISIAQLDPIALINLRETGKADFSIPEVLFDLDFPSHYFRRIKSVSLSIPCIAGPYTSVNAQLFLLKGKYRKTPLINSEYEERFGAIQSIATSHAQNDSGVFELNFRDERYLPFEGCGVISSWRLELPIEVRQFDYNSISDVIVHVKYTSREGGSNLKAAANAALKDQLDAIKQGLDQTGLHIALNMKHDMSNEWLLLKKNGAIELKLDKSRLPYLAQTLSSTEIESVMFIAKIKDNPATFMLNIDGSDTSLKRVDVLNLCKGISSNINLDTAFTLSVSNADKSKLDELMMIVKYKVTVP